MRARRLCVFPNVVLDPNLRPGIWFKDTNNFAPRIGLAYRLTNTAAIRAGYGVFYAKTQGNELQFKINTPPTVVAATLVGSLTTPNVLADRDLFPDPASPSFPVSTLSPFSVDPSDRTPYLQQWNLSWQQELPGQLLGEVAYVGSVGHKLAERTNINQAVPPANPASPTPIAERRPFPGFRRYSFSLVSGELQLQFAAGAAGAALLERPGVPAVLHLVALDRHSLPGLRRFVASEHSESEGRPR